MAGFKAKGGGGSAIVTDGEWDVEFVDSFDIGDSMSATLGPLFVPDTFDLTELFTLSDLYLQDGFDTDDAITLSLSMEDTVDMSDSLSATLGPINVPDTFDMSDTFVAYELVLGDSIDLSDSPTLYFGNFDDSVDISDSMSATLGPIQIPDTLDVVDEFFPMDLTVQESVDVSDAMQALTLSTTQTDSFSMSDALGQIIYFTNETFDVVDSTVLALTVPDSVTVEDSFGAITELTTQDSFDTDDAATVALEVQWDDTFDTTDNPVVEATLPDTLNTTDTLVETSLDLTEFSEVVAFSSQIDNPNNILEDTTSTAAVSTVTSATGLTSTQRTENYDLQTTLGALEVVNVFEDITSATAHFEWSAQTDNVALLVTSASFTINYEVMVDGVNWVVLDTHNETGFGGATGESIAKHTVSYDILSQIGDDWTKISEMAMRVVGTNRSGTSLTGLGTSTCTINFFRMWINLTSANGTVTLLWNYDHSTNGYHLTVIENIPSARSAPIAKFVEGREFPATPGYSIYRDDDVMNITGDIAITTTFDLDTLVADGQRRVISSFSDDPYDETSGAWNLSVIGSAGNNFLVFSQDGQADVVSGTAITTGYHTATVRKVSNNVEIKQDGTSVATATTGAATSNTGGRLSLGNRGDGGAVLFKGMSYKDASGNGNDLTLFDAAPPAPGWMASTTFGYGLNISEEHSLTAPVNFNGVSALTMEAVLGNNRYSQTTGFGVYGNSIAEQQVIITIGASGLVLLTIVDNASTAHTLTSVTNINNAGDTHVRAVWDGSTAYLLLNGVVEDSTPVASLKQVSASTHFVLGDNSDPAVTTDFGGAIYNEVRLSDVARDGGGAYTPPTGPWSPDNNTMALYHFEGPQTDADLISTSGIGPLNRVNNGGTLITDGPFGNAARRLGVVLNYYNFDQSTALNPVQNDSFCIGFWLRFNSFGSGSEFRIAGQVPGTPQQLFISRLLQSTNTMQFISYAGGNTAETVSYNIAGNFDDGNWHWFVHEHTPTTNTIYHNGVQVAQAAAGSLRLSATGATSVGQTFNADCSVDLADVCVFEGTASADRIAVPQAPLTKQSTIWPHIYPLSTYVDLGVQEEPSTGLDGAIYDLRIWNTPPAQSVLDTLVSSTGTDDILGSELAAYRLRQVSL